MNIYYFTSPSSQKQLIELPRRCGTYHEEQGTLNSLLSLHHRLFSTSFFTTFSFRSMISQLTKHETELQISLRNTVTLNLQQQPRP